MFTSATFAKTSVRLKPGEDMALVGAAFAAGVAGFTAAGFGGVGVARAAAGAGTARSFRSRLRWLWTTDRMDASGAVTPRAFTRLMTSSAGISRLPARMRRTAGVMAGAAGFGLVC